MANCRQRGLGTIKWKGWEKGAARVHPDKVAQGQIAKGGGSVSLNSGRTFGQRGRQKEGKSSGKTYAVMKIAVAFQTGQEMATKEGLLRWRTGECRDETLTTSVASKTAV